MDRSPDATADGAPLTSMSATAAEGPPPPPPTPQPPLPPPAAVARARCESAADGSLPSPGLPLRPPGLLPARGVMTRKAPGLLERDGSEGRGAWNGNGVHGSDGGQNDQNRSDQIGPDVTAGCNGQMRRASGNHGLRARPHCIAAHDHWARPAPASPQVRVRKPLRIPALAPSRSPVRFGTVATKPPGQPQRGARGPDEPRRRH